MLSRIFLSIYATVEMNTELDPVGTAVPGEIPGEKITFKHNRFHRCQFLILVIVVAFLVFYFRPHNNNLFVLFIWLQILIDVMQNGLCRPAE